METKELTIESLMIGDWVMYNPNVFIEDEYEPTKQCYPKKILNGEDIDLAIENCYTPIPLTAEILEKIGFKKKTDGTFELIYNEKGAYIEMNYNPISGHLSANWHWFIANHIYYVHELQHALKMSQVNNEIEL